MGEGLRERGKYPEEDTWPEGEGQISGTEGTQAWAEQKEMKEEKDIRFAS